MIYAFDDAGLHWTHHRHDYAHHHPKQQPLPQLDYALDADAHRERSDDDDKDSNNKKAPQYADSQQPFLWRNSLEHGAQQYYPITDSDIMDTPISPQEVSPLGSELGSLPLPDTMSLIPHQQPHVLDSSSAWKEYTQLWRQLIEDSSLFNFNSFTSSSTQQGLVGLGLGLDAEPEPTPPLDLEISPVVHFAPEPSAGQGHTADGNGSTNSRSTISTLTSNTTSVELVAPKPRRLVNPAIHLAALVEEDDTNSITASRTAEEDVQERDREVMVPEEEIQEEILAIAVPAATPTAMYSGHSLEELREYMSDSEHSSSGEMVLDDQEECGFDTVSSLDVLLPASSEPSSDAFNFNGWSFPREGYYYPATYQAPLPSQSQEVVAPPAPPSSSSSSGPSPLHAIVAPQYNHHSRPSQLREAMRERRAARQVLQTHSRHASLPDVQYRPAKWTVPMPAEPAPVHHYLPQQQQYARTAILAPHRRRERDASRSVDWSALASQNMILVPPPDDYTYHTAPQYAAVPLYGMQPSFYGGH